MKSVSLFHYKCEKCFNFFDKMRKVFYFFSTKCEKCFTFFDKMRKVFQFFLHKDKSVFIDEVTFYLFTVFLVFFRIFLQKLIKIFNMCASSEHLIKF